MTVYPVCISLCISLPTSAALSALTESSLVLLNPVEKDMSNPFSITVKWLVLLKPFLGKFNYPSISHHLCFGKVSVEWSLFPNIFLNTLVDRVITKITKGEHPALVARVSFSFSLCSVHLLT